MTTSRSAGRAAAAVLAACEAEDWSAAREAVAEFDRWVRDTAEAGGFASRDELSAVMAEHAALSAELQRRLAETASELGAMSQGGRGIEAYRAG